MRRKAGASCIAEAPCPKAQVRSRESGKQFIFGVPARALVSATATALFALFVFNLSFVMVTVFHAGVSLFDTLSSTPCAELE